MARKTLILFAVVLVVLCIATASFAASGGEPGRPDSPGRSDDAKSEHAAQHDPSNPDGTYRGKSASTPDQDGIGADHGIDNNDKTGAGTDGNNGCGNDADREDDNNGWCGRKPAASPSVSPTETVTVSPTPTATSSVGTSVLGREFTRPQTEVAGRDLARTGMAFASVVLGALALLVLGSAFRAIASPKS